MELGGFCSASSILV